MLYLLLSGSVSGLIILVNTCPGHTFYLTGIAL